MKPKMRFLWKIIALYSIVTVYAGFGDPRKARELLRKRYGQPCDCRGGQISELPSDRITQEKCCFYANKSGIVRDKIKTLQEELEKRRKGLAANPLWTGLDGLLPYLLPFLGPLLTLLLFLTLGPIILNKLMAFVRQQIEAFQAKPIQVHYHRLEMTENGESYLP
ncbi:syncytin-1-like [Papio anubis]|uniref:syncytin-1-like n=1 Tax=Papio anubis TaxID=9555 RepID=UPI0012AD74EC|nr:syncytin-1-like [Papio anubis]